jgi:hypothetical protein
MTYNHTGIRPVNLAYKCIMPHRANGGALSFIRLAKCFCKTGGSGYK